MKQSELWLVFRRNRLCVPEVRFSCLSGDSDGAEQGQGWKEWTTAGLQMGWEPLALEWNALDLDARRPRRMVEQM